MPHKHKRSKSQSTASTHDLPPSKYAHALPVKAFPPNPKRKHAALQDDTPRAFARLLRPYRPPRSGLDDGVRAAKKSKTTTATTTTTTTTTAAAEQAVVVPVPTILPSESLSVFNARVDAALPLAGVAKTKGGKQTRTERKMQGMQREWREEERRLREKREEEADVALGEDGGEEAGGGGVGKKKKGKGRRKGGMEEEDEEDPWAHIQAKRVGDGKVGGGGNGGLVGLHDVVLAPPKFSRVPKGKEDFGVGKGIVGLKNREELSEARRSVIEGYRLMMRQRRGEGG